MILIINSDNDQRQLAQILFVDSLLIKLKYVSQNTIYHKVTRPNKHFQVNGNFNAIRVNSRIVGWESQLQLFITITNVLRHKIEV